MDPREAEAIKRTKASISPDYTARYIRVGRNMLPGSDSKIEAVEGDNRITILANRGIEATSDFFRFAARLLVFKIGMVGGKDFTILGTVSGNN